MAPRLAPVHRYVALIVLSGMGLLLGLVANSFHPSEYRSLHFWIFFLAVILGELFPIRLPRKTQTLTVTASGTFTFALLITHGLAAAVLALVAAGLVDDIRQRKPWWKASFNASQYALSVGAGGAVLSLLSDLPRPDGLFEINQLPVILLAGAAYFAVNWLITGVAIALAERTPMIQSLRTDAGLISATDIILLALAPIVVAVATYSLWLLPLLTLPMVAVYKSATMSLRNIELADNLRALYETTRLSYGEQKLDHSIRSLLEQTCQMFRAERAMLTLLPSSDEVEALESTFHVNGVSSFMQPVRLDPREGVWARVIAEEAALRVERSDVSKKLQTHLELEEISGALVAPVRGNQGVIGIMQVANRVQGAFGDDDLKLFETLANHAGISVENARLVTRLEESLAHLTEMNRLKDDFVASVSHELRTPLTSIKGYVGTLLRKDAKFSEDQKRDFLETVARQSNRLQRLIEDLLAVSRIESTVTFGNVSTVSLPGLVADVLDELRDRLEDHPMSVQLDADLPAIDTDEGKVHQILANLVDNAMKYSSRGAPVTITGHRDRDGVVIFVSDQGQGIPTDQQAKIFERFYQVDQSSTRTVGGTGLGLYICRTMAEALEGRIWLDHSDEKGSVFGLWIPTRFWAKTPDGAPAAQVPPE